MQAADLVSFALDTLKSPSAASQEASYRRAISACYYALFHRLAGAGAQAFSRAGDATANQARRAFKHTEMKTVCERYCAWAPGKRLPAPLNSLIDTTPDPRLIRVAASFVRLQELRETADYDLIAALDAQDASEALRLAARALAEFDAIEHDPATQTFLTALLMADRWKRGG